ncbi:MAG TPA: dienelactone hydrolase family protein [Acetobacteraceae bacterium]|jgi:dienelactone hydrolase
MHKLLRLSLVALSITLFVHAGSAASSTDVSIPPQAVPGSRMPTKPIPATLMLPDGKGPFPAIIVLHGCSGPRPGQTVWAQRLNGWGYAALIPSSFFARGVYAGVCGSYRASLVTPQDRAGDVISAAIWLRTQPEIDGARIGVLGNSNGGRTAAVITERRYEELYPHLIKAAVDYYGACGDAAAKGTVPLLALAGEADTYGYPARACQQFGTQLQPSQVFELHTYPGAVHEFDNPTQLYTVSLGHPLAYDHDPAEDSYARVKTFLNRYVGSPGS